jgi:putative ABC transport system permease protein
MQRSDLGLARAALRQLWRYRLRSTLIITAAALGVAGAIVAVNYAAGGRQKVIEQIQRQGTNLIVVRAEAQRSVAGRARVAGIVTTLREADRVAILRGVDGLVRSSAVVSGSLRLKAQNLSTVATVVGCEPDYFSIRSWPAESGELFADPDVRRSARVALLGADLTRDLFGDTPPTGERLFINRVPFVVLGVMRERGQGLDVGNDDRQVYVPVSTAMRRLLGVEHYNAIFFEVADWRRMERVTADITALLRQRHRSSALRPDDFRVQSQKELIDTQAAAGRRLTFLVRWVGLSALAVAGLGVLAIAWIAVRDRTREIGTRRAIGATARDVFLQFAFEATVLSTAGIGVGLLVGFLGSAFAARAAQLPFAFDAANAALAVGSAFVLNLLFASWPALRAARLDPIAALRHD